MPEDLVEYVLVHELVHATQPPGPDHGRAWQTRMDVALPSWRHRKARLAEASKTIWRGTLADVPTSDAGARGALARHRHYLAHRNEPASRYLWSLATGQEHLARETPPPGHRPAVLEMPWDEHTPGYPSPGPGKWRMLRRGACTGCAFEGPDRTSYNDAVEDALDHTHAGWRDLPIVEWPRSSSAARAWRSHLDATHPPGWFDRQGPVRTWCDPIESRHRFGRAPGGGYMVAVRREEEPAPQALQLSLQEDGRR
ncbi:DUF6349 family protein [Embleya sp. NPDC059237]|uniref:DUF6349 family protein n=1 Tax=Embleya sp. NPDC059237 TaxID=3346784 RepID=UPI0036A91D9C